MAVTVRVRNGRVEEFENGTYRRSYGSNIVAASTDGMIVAAVNKSGRVEEYERGAYQRSYGTKAVGVQVSGGVVAVQTSTGRTEEYVNGCIPSLLLGTVTHVPVLFALQLEEDDRDSSGEDVHSLICA